MSTATKPYVLGPGGKFGRYEDGNYKVYATGDTVYLTDEQATGRALKGRLTPAGAVRLAKAVEAANANPAVAEAAADAPSPTTTAARARNWAFLSTTDHTTIAEIIETMDDPAELDALKAAEFATDGKKRTSVRNAVAKRKRQLGAERAQKARREKAAERKAAAASGEGEDAENGGGAAAADKE